MARPLTIEELEKMHEALRTAFDRASSDMGHHTFSSDRNVYISALATAATALIEADRYLQEKKDENNPRGRLDK